MILPNITPKDTFDFIRQLLLAPENTSEGKAFAKESKIHDKLPLYIDRLIELVKNYPLSPREFGKLVKTYGWPTSELYKEEFTRRFTDSSPTGLHNSYMEQDLVYAARLMLGYHRAEFIAPYLDKIEEISGGKRLDVLDYGCGVADISLGLATRGHNVTLVDIDIKRYKLTKSRFSNRGLNFDAVTLPTTEMIPDLGTNTFDLALLTEVFEHVRRPRELLESVSNALRPGGLMLNSMGIEFERETGGDHLDESLAEGASPEFWSEYWNSFDLVQGTKEPWLFQRKNYELLNNDVGIGNI